MRVRLRPIFKHSIELGCSRIIQNIKMTVIKYLLFVFVGYFHDVSGEYTWTYVFLGGCYLISVAIYVTVAILIKGNTSIARYQKDLVVVAGDPL